MLVEVLILYGHNLAQVGVVPRSPTAAVPPHILGLRSA